MVDQLLGEFEHNLGSVTLIPSTGGVYEVIVGDELVYSKKATGRHAEYAEVAEPVRALVAAS
jgi:selenoprotein W-related protein